MAQTRKRIYIIEWLNLDSSEWCPEAFRLSKDTAELCMGRMKREAEAEGASAIYRIAPYLREPKKK